MTNFTIIKKVRVSLENWSQTVDLQTTYEKVRAVKIKWLQYTTASANNKELLIRCSNLGGAGTKPLNGSNTDYFICFPLDLATPVSCTFTNYTEEYDIVYNVDRSFNVLNFQTFINGLPATSDITPSNSVELEIAFYA